MRLDVCSRCAGVFASHDVLNGVVESEGAVDELRAVLPRAASAWAEGGRMYVACPVCEALMNRKQYATGAKIVTDTCKHHGVWFDAGELPRVLDFIASGGLAEASGRDVRAAREVARRAELDRELARPEPGRYESSLAVEFGFAVVIEAILGKLR